MHFGTARSQPKPVMHACFALLLLQSLFCLTLLLLLQSLHLFPNVLQVCDRCVAATGANLFTSGITHYLCATELCTAWVKDWATSETKDEHVPAIVCGSLIAGHT